SPRMELSQKQRRRDRVRRSPAPEPGNLMGGHMAAKSVSPKKSAKPEIHDLERLATITGQFVADFLMLMRTSPDLAETVAASLHQNLARLEAGRRQAGTDSVHRSK